MVTNGDKVEKGKSEMTNTFNNMWEEDFGGKDNKIRQYSICRKLVKQQKNQES